ncbi:HNH endonuclease signature motif containing protein, partial [Arthrobacter sp. PsM3]|uniref:HNH endonuclease signature motif containing protein n=1 Tax=Arthrobacter sp. PsM3 TaxID=3030531 RepID=UPI00263A863E
LDNDADHLLAWADGGTTGISNLGQPCPKHHRLKHGSAWAPTGASKDKPPGWTSPSGRHYPSEQQDWEPPHWPPGLLPKDTDTDTFSDTFTEMDPGPDPDQELPEDPFPDWHHFTAAHPWPEPDPEDPVYPEDLYWPEPLDDAHPESVLPQSA